VPEEFYDHQNDPSALKNLIDDPHYKEEIAKLRTRMLRIMQSIDDPLLGRLEKTAAAQSAPSGTPAR